MQVEEILKRLKLIEENNAGTVIVTVDFIKSISNLIYTQNEKMKQLNLYNKYEHIIKNKIVELELMQDENVKELNKGIDYLSREMINAASDKIKINMSVRDYLQNILKEGEK